MPGDVTDDGIRGFLRRLREEMLLDASKKLAWWLLGTVAAAFALLIWRGGSVPAWTLLVTVLVLMVAAVWWRGHTKQQMARALSTQRERSNEELDALTSERDEVSDEADAMAYGLERYDTYSKHIAQALDALQRILSGDIDVDVSHYIEQALLEPARDLLLESPADHVRLSVLLPADDGETWWMPFAAGHSLIGKSKYSERIADTLSRVAFESDEPQHWEDVTADSSFKANPKGSSPIRTMVSLPVKFGDRVVGVFNVVSSETDAFDPAELTYVSALGGVLSVAVGVFLKEHLKEADAG